MVCVARLQGLTWDLVQPISLVSSPSSLSLPWAAPAALTCFWSLEPDKLGFVSGASHWLFLLRGTLSTRSLQGSPRLNTHISASSHLPTKASLNSRRLQAPLPLVILDPISLFYFLPGIDFSRKVSIVCSLSLSPSHHPLQCQPLRAHHCQFVGSHCCGTQNSAWDVVGHAL